MTEKHIALVTGGAQGIGYACAEAIGEDGAQIVLADINGEEVKNAASRLGGGAIACLLYTSPSPRDKRQSRMPSSA